MFENTEEGLDLGLFFGRSSRKETQKEQNTVGYPALTIEPYTEPVDGGKPTRRLLLSEEALTMLNIISTVKNFLGFVEVENTMYVAHLVGDEAEAASKKQSSMIKRIAKSTGGVTSSRIAERICNMYGLNQDIENRFELVKAQSDEMLHRGYTVEMYEQTFRVTMYKLCLPPIDGQNMEEEEEEEVEVIGDAEPIAENTFVNAAFV